MKKKQKIKHAHTTTTNNNMQRQQPKEPPLYMHVGVPAANAGRAGVRARRVSRGAAARKPRARRPRAGAGRVGQRAVHAPGDVCYPADLRQESGHVAVRATA